MENNLTDPFKAMEDFYQRQEEMLARFHQLYEQFRSNTDPNLKESLYNEMLEELINATSNSK